MELHDLFLLVYHQIQPLTHLQHLLVNVSHSIRQLEADKCMPKILYRVLTDLVVLKFTAPGVGA